MKFWLCKALFLTLPIVSYAANSGPEKAKEIDLEELKVLASSIPCLQPLVAQMPEYLAYLNLKCTQPHDGGAYVIDHTHQQIYMQQHVIEQIPFLSAMQAFERQQQGSQNNSTLTLKIDHPDIKATLLSWLSEIIEQDMHKVDKETRLCALMGRRLPSKNETKAMRNKLALNELADAIDEARRKKLQAKNKKEKEKAMKTSHMAGVWKLDGGLKIPYVELSKNFAAGNNYYTQDIDFKGIKLYFNFEKRDTVLGIFLHSRSPDVFIEWSGSMETSPISVELHRFTKQGWGIRDVMKIADLEALKKPNLNFSFKIKMTVE